MVEWLWLTMGNGWLVMVKWMVSGSEIDGEWLSLMAMVDGRWLWVPRLNGWLNHGELMPQDDDYIMHDWCLKMVCGGWMVSGWRVDGEWIVVDGWLK